MNSEIIEEWLHWFNAQITGRKVIPLIDNFSTYKVIAANIKSSISPLQNTIIM